VQTIYRHSSIRWALGALVLCGAPSLGATSGASSDVMQESTKVVASENLRFCLSLVGFSLGVDELTDTTALVSEANALSANEYVSRRYTARYSGKQGPLILHVLVTESCAVELRFLTPADFTDLLRSRLDVCEHITFLRSL